MKKVLLLAIGNRTPSWLRELEREYAMRVQRFDLQIQLLRASSPDKEAAAVMRAAAGADLYLLDAGGVEYDSAGFAEWLAGRLESAAAVALVIGGASGLPPPLRGQAQGIISLSSLTFAHHITRAVLVEQLFRADCIMRGHPYPK